MIDVWSAVPDKQAPQTGTIDTEWADNRLIELLNELYALPQHNVNKPGSPFYTTLVKIGSLVKGSHLTYGRVLQQIVIVYAGRGVSENEITYQYRRAYQRAKPLIRGAC